MEIVSGNLLEATEDYIVQQNNCRLCKAHGLSASIAEKWPWGDPYAKRRPVRKGLNTAIPEDMPPAGSIEILAPLDPTNKKRVICIYGQVDGGRPNTRVPNDLAADRVVYFKQGLAAITATLPAGTTLAFPYKIGCGLAGGNWATYSLILTNWIAANPQFKVRIYKMD